MATEDVFYSNLEKGTIGNFIKLEGFFYDRLGRMGTPLFDAWKDYRAQAPINFLVILFALIPFIGMLKNSRYRLPFILCYTLMVFGLLTNTFPINVINNVVRSNSFINQVFRSPFTKFIIPYSLVTTYFFTYGIYAVYESYNKYVSKKLTIYPLNFAAIIGLLICIYSFPAFNGQYLSSEMKVSIPQDYFKVMEYFKHEDKNKKAMSKEAPPPSPNRLVDREIYRPRQTPEKCGASTTFRCISNQKAARKAAQPKLETVEA
jgi:hypothetical protein